MKNKGKIILCYILFERICLCCCEIKHKAYGIQLHRPASCLKDSSVNFAKAMLSSSERHW